MKIIVLFFFTIILNACGSTNTTSSLSDNTMNNNKLDGNYTIKSLESQDNLSQALTIIFDSTTNRVSGFSGCNTFTGNYTLNNNILQIGTLASTRKMCLENDNTLESKMLQTLGEINGFNIKDTTLTLSQGDKKLITASKINNSKVAQNNIKIEYKAHSRGAFSQIILDNKTVSVKNGRTTEPNVKTCSTEDWNAILEQVSELNLKALPTLEAPSKAHQYDGAALANFSITKDGETYSVPTFDAGNPNEEIKSLYKLVMKISDSTKEKN